MCSYTQTANADFIDDIENLADEYAQKYKHRIDPEAPGLPIQLTEPGRSDLFHYNFGIYGYQPELYAGRNTYTRSGAFESYKHYGFFSDFAGIRYKEANDMLRGEIGTTYNGRFYFNVIATHDINSRSPLSTRFLVKDGDVNYSLRTSYMDPFLKGDLQTIRQIDVNEEDIISLSLSHNFNRRLTDRYDIIAGTYLRVAAKNEPLSTYAYLGFGRDIRLRDYKGRLQISFDTKGEVTFKLTKEIDFRFM